MAIKEIKLYVCDRCGYESDSKYDFFKLNLEYKKQGSFMSFYREVYGSLEDKLLCENCFNQIKEDIWKVIDFVKEVS